MARHAFVDIADVMRKRADDFPRAAARLMRGVAAAIGEEVARETPVDTGTARSNWIMTVGEIANYVIPAYVPYRKTTSIQYKTHKETGPHIFGMGDKEETANLEAVMSQHFVALQTFDPTRDDTVYLANNVRYIGMLNDGYSMQTPAGFVERSIDKGVEAARNIRLLEPV